MKNYYDWESGASNFEFDNSVPSVDSSGNSPAGGGFNLGLLAKMGKIAGIGIGAYGNMMIGEKQQDAYNFNADLVMQQQEFTEDQIETYGEEVLSTQRAIYARSGVAYTGSPLDAALKSATNIEMSKQISRYNAETKANMNRYYGEVSAAQGKIKAGETLLSGGLSLLGLGF